jgi:hypothetical protein
MTKRMAADNEHRTTKNVSGPASLVPYLATMNPVLHSNTKRAGANRCRGEEVTE